MYITHACKRNFPQKLMIDLQVFQRIWSARVMDEKAAWQLISLVDQIHAWAITDFRTFVLEHLRPWHKFCNDNYLLDWNSAYDTSQELKWVRACNHDEDVLLPNWVSLVKAPFQQKIQARAKSSLARAILEDSLHKGKGKAIPQEFDWSCNLDQCSPSRERSYPAEAFLNHLRDFHQIPEDELVQAKKCLIEPNGLETNTPKALIVSGMSDKRRFCEAASSVESSLESLSISMPGPSKRLRVA